MVGCLDFGEPTPIAPVTMGPVFASLLRLRLRLRPSLRRLAASASASSLGGPLLVWRAANRQSRQRAALTLASPLPVAPVVERLGPRGSLLPC